MQRWPIVSFKAPAALAAALHDHADRTGLTVSEVVRAALTDYLGAAVIAAHDPAADPALLALAEALETHLRR